MSNDQFLTGRKFGRLRVIMKNGKENGHVYWFCLCECGNQTIVRSQDLLSGHTKSCGCLRMDHAITHGMSGTPLYQTWINMKTRCYNSKHFGYRYYGGRGIEVYQPWLESFEEFRDYCFAHGYEEGLTIDRIDNSLGYKPGNVQFLTKSEHSKKTWDDRKAKQERESLMELEPAGMEA